MNDGVAFTLAQMETLFNDASECQKAYENAVKNLETEVGAMKSFWTSNETGTYEEFKALFDQKLPTLQEANTMMIQFCNKINEKKAAYQEAANRTINMFQ